MGDKMSRGEIRAMMNDLSSTPYTRFKDKAAYFLAKVCLFVGLVWVLTHLDDIVNWMNGK